MIGQQTMQFATRVAARRLFRKLRESVRRMGLPVRGYFDLARGLRWTSRQRQISVGALNFDHAPVPANQGERDEQPARHESIESSRVFGASYDGTSNACVQSDERLRTIALAAGNRVGSRQPRLAQRLQNTAEVALRLAAVCGHEQGLER